MKFCIDCHWYKNRGALCRHPSLGHQAVSYPIDGGVVHPRALDARAERSAEGAGGPCGPDATLFAPMKWLQRMIRQLNW